MEIDSLSTAEKKPPKLRWYQWRLRSLFVLTLLVAVAMSWLTVMMRNQRKQKAAAEEITKAGGKVMTEPTWLGKLLRDDSLVIVTFVDLYKTKTTDAGLDRLKVLTELQTLTLWDAKITDAGLERLKVLTELQSLYLDGCTKVTDAGLEHLKGLTKLQTLSLGKTKITNAGLPP